MKEFCEDFVVAIVRVVAFARLVLLAIGVSIYINVLKTYMFIANGSETLHYKMESVRTTVKMLDEKYYALYPEQKAVVKVFNWSIGL